MFERRKTQRFPAFLGGVISFAQHRASAECIIRNQSGNGARLVLYDPSFIPDEFELTIPQRQTTLRARTRWRDYDSLGIEFLASEPNESLLGATAVRRLKRLERENRLLKRRLRERRP